MIQIRRATPEDAEPLAPLAAQMFRDGWVSVIGESIAESYIAGNLTAAHLEMEMRDPHSFFIIAADADHKTMGYAKLNRARPAPECVALSPSALLQRLYVLAEYRGAGVANILLDTLAVAARRREYQSLWLECDPRNSRAWRYYEKRGFVDVGGNIYYYTQSDGTTAIANDQVRIMEKTLKERTS